MPIPALIIAGTHSGSGKTTATLAILAALTRRGRRVQAFKVGPDFIDPGHHTLATGRPSRNLDTWLLDPPTLDQSFCRACQGADVAIIEGVMGLFDGRGGRDEAGSTADLARLWDLPVLLVVDAGGLARSIAPLVQGFASFDPRVRVAGVLANRVGSARHFNQYLAPALESVPEARPLGYLLRDERLSMPSRHLGLVTAAERGFDAGFFNTLADAAEATIDLDAVLALASEPAVTHHDPAAEIRNDPRSTTRVALARDQAFCFYYEDNLDLLRAAGAELISFSPLHDNALPEGVDLVYLGGGYPELFAAEIASNGRMRAALRGFHRAGGRLFAECGGLMACCRELRDRSGDTYPMWDLIPARVSMRDRLAALGYVTVMTSSPTLLGPAGIEVRGHEYHYSTLEPLGRLPYATRLVRSDRPDEPDGISIGGLLAGYAHLHFGSNPAVATSLLGDS